MSGVVERINDWLHKPEDNRLVNLRSIANERVKCHDENCISQNFDITCSKEVERRGYDPKVFFTCRFDPLLFAGDHRYKLVIEHGVPLERVVHHLKKGFTHDVCNLYMRKGLSERLGVKFPYSESFRGNWDFYAGDILFVMCHEMCYINNPNCITMITFEETENLDEL